MGAVLGVLLRNYGFTDLPPSLHVPRSDPVTRITESSYRRQHHQHHHSTANATHQYRALVTLRAPDAPPWLAWIPSSALRDTR